MSEECGAREKKERPIGKITILIGLIGVTLIPTAIFVPLFAVAIGALSLSEMERMQSLLGLFALMFGTMFVGLVLSTIMILKGDENDKTRTP